jgi:penicillin amidase
VAPDGYPYLLANQWGSPYRTERIYKVLEQSLRDANKKFSAADMLALQMDTASAYDRLVADHFVYAIDHATTASPRVHRGADLMRAWNGRVDIDAVGPTIGTLARQRLTQIMLRPKFGDDWNKYQWFESSVAFEKILQTKPQRWVAPGFATFDDMLVVAVDQAITYNSDKQGLTSPTWLWGNKFPLDIEHPVFGSIPVLRTLAAPGVKAQSGNGSATVKAAGRNFGASERITMDLSNFDSSTLNIVTGQSGQLFSRYYNDQWTAWYTGKTFAWPFSESAVNSASAHKLTLTP